MNFATKEFKSQHEGGLTKKGRDFWRKQFKFKPCCGKIRSTLSFEQKKREGEKYISEKFRQGKIFVSKNFARENILKGRYSSHAAI